MKKFILIVLYLLTPSLFGEMLSGATSPISYFNPMTIFIFVIIYGLPLLLIRELMVKWQLKHTRFFLFALIGIIIEGLIMQSFFNIYHTNLDTLSGYGVFLGVQIPWMLLTISSHGILSGAVPVVLLENIWPKYKKTALLNKRAFFILLWITIIGIVIVSVLIIGTLEEFKAYTINPLHLIATIITVIFSIKYAYKKRNDIPQMKKTPPSPKKCFIQSFLIMLFLSLGPFILASLMMPSVVTIILQLLSILMIYRWVNLYAYHPQITAKHTTSCLLGALCPWLLMTPIHEYFNGDPGMIITGIIFALVLLLWKKSVEKKGLQV